MVKAALLLVSLFLVVALIEAASVQNDYLDQVLKQASKDSEVEGRKKTFEDVMDEAFISSILEKNEMATLMEESATSQLLPPIFFTWLENSEEGQNLISVLCRRRRG